ncbi:MAG TPA: hypothetical protein VIF09_26160, partial [Polyangiaceae bacterium]
MRQSTAVRVLGLVLAASGLFPASARAADRRAEATARAALEKAADDYLATNYAAGTARLQKALRACGASKCSAATKAALFRDIGTMQFRAGDVGAARKSWASAVHLQAGIALNPNYDAPDVRAAFGEGKGGASDADAGGAQPMGDFTHTPVAEQRVDTPVPVYAEYPGGNIARVIVKYRGATANDWSHVDLHRMGSGWGGLVPCGDVAKGTLRYWIQGFDDGGDPVASSGDPKHSYTVPIRDDIASEAPHLPGKPAPKACSESNDCPPGMPGCAGDEKEPAETVTESPSEKEPAATQAFARVWFGVSGELPEFIQLPGGN